MGRTDWAASYWAADYIKQFLIPEKLQRCVCWAKKALQSRMSDFDTIAFRGMSGALIAPPVARAMKKSLIMVRKRLERRHSSYDVEGYTDVSRYIILDDFVSSGETAQAVVEGINRFALESVVQRRRSPTALKPVCLGVLEAYYLSKERVAQYMYTDFPLSTFWMEEQEDRKAEELKPGPALVVPQPVAKEIPGSRFFSCGRPTQIPWGQNLTDFFLSGKGEIVENAETVEQQL